VPRCFRLHLLEYTAVALLQAELLIDTLGVELQQGLDAITQGFLLVLGPLAFRRYCIIDDLLPRREDSYVCAIIVLATVGSSTCKVVAPDSVANRVSAEPHDRNLN